VPNVVIDGSPKAGTVLTLTHWPGYPQPTGYHFDLSAEMAFHFLDAPIAHPPADVVTNNHYDQDGLVGLHALVDPEQSVIHGELLIGIAAAGDCAKAHDRRAARASMTIDAYADPERSPIAERLTGSYDEQCVALYQDTLALLISIASDSERFRDLWADEDAELASSERLIAHGTVTIEERHDIDLAVVTIPENERTRRGHRFAGESFEGIHPMALHAATDRFRLLVVHGRRYRFVDRYETWVQFRSRPTLQRVDMRPLAERLTERETGSARWVAAAPGSLTPTMTVSEESSLDHDVVRAMIVAHLNEAPPAWDPYKPHS